MNTSSQLAKKKFYSKTPPLTDQNKTDIKKLFYRGLREGESIVDNRACVIAKELNLPQGKVFYFISKSL